MNIVISLSYYPKPETGTGNAVHGFAKGLISAGANVTILAEGDRYLKSEYEGVPFIQFLQAKGRNPFKVSAELCIYLKSNLFEIDLLIVNGIYVPYVYTLAKFSKNIGIPYIHVPHSVYSKISFKKSRIKKSVYFRFFEKEVIENALAVQMLSENQIADVVRLASPNNCIFVPNGINKKAKDLSAKSLSTLSRAPAQKIRIIFFGRKEMFMKGLDLLIEAFSRIRNDNVELFIQGSSNGDDEKLEKLIRNLGVKNIFLKEKFEGDIIKHLQKFDIFIMPSRYEAFSIAVLEGMLAELPIIVSKEVGAAPFVLKAQAGIECEPTTDGVYNAICKMLNEKENWIRMGLNGRKYLSENLTWGKIAKDALSTYQNLLNKKV